jgi:lipoprotein NlpI
MSRTTTTSLTAVGLVAALTMGCGGSSSSGPDANDPSAQKDARGNVISAAAQSAFEAGLRAMQQHDKANDWNDANCKSTAAKFMEAAEEQKDDRDKVFYEAKYNAGVAHQRCKHDAEAKAIFQDILQKNPKYHRAQVQVALYDFKASGEKDVEGAISSMEKAVRDAEFKNVEALVQLAALQMIRRSDRADDDGENDLERAKKNLQRALAINDAFMPAFNQLAIYYLERAKEKAGRRRGRVRAAVTEKKKVGTQALELAALVVSQAVRKNPYYGPVYNTSGLISAELGDLSAAAQAFGKARQLDKKFFEAHMNYAAVNLQFRGFKQAEAAYRDALKLRPNDYEAHLGLALAIRGQINDVNFDKNLAESMKHVEAAKKIDPARAETYYNEAILVQEFKARGGKGAEKAMLEAKNLFQQFISKAGGGDEFEDAVKRSKERMEEIDQIIEFNRQTKKEQERMEQERKRREAEEMKKKGKK